MKRKFKRAVAVGIAATTMAVAMGGFAVNASYVDDNTARASKSWDVRHIGGGAPSSSDVINRFYIYYSSGGFTGNCATLTTTDTEFGVNVTTLSDHTMSKSITWNGTGQKTWTVSANPDHVRYQVSPYGTMTYSTGTITRN